MTTPTADPLHKSAIAHLLRACSDEIAVTVVQQTSSTNDLARAWLDGRELGQPGVAAFASERQTAARARRGRNWFSAPGQAVLLSIALCTPHTPAGTNAYGSPMTRGGWEEWPLLAAIAARRALQDVAGQGGSVIDIQLKWPNDLMVHGRKLAGILCEQSSGGLVIGIGVNVHGDMASAAPELALTATSLAQEGARVSRNSVIAAVIRHTFELFAQTQRGLRFSDLRCEYTRASSTVGKQIVVVQGTRTLSGIARQVDGQGALWLETGDGRLVAVAAGEVIEGDREGGYPIG
ncbi:MAG: biotin--[acetyl-CoA-carboxylase] ligase [Firmicutes bacterium]|nr:biotin--[acetyl-CoA-carboxylase] ligase [Bacillota bacterium]